jgi:hypothetical protein
VRGAEPALLNLARAIGGARLALHEDNADMAIARVALAESLGDRAALADALNATGLMYSATMPAYAEMHLRAARDIAREEQRPILQHKILMNLALLVVLNDLSAGRAMLAEAAAERRRIGGSSPNEPHEIANRATIDVAMGEWQEAEALLDTRVEAAPLTYMRCYLDALLARACARPRKFAALPEGLRSTDDEALLSVVAGVDMFDAWSRGDVQLAAAKAVECARRQADVSGLTDDLIHLWPSAMECALASGDATALERTLAVIDDQPPGFLGVGFRAHRARFAALLAIKDGADKSVEASLRSAIGGFEDWGSWIWAAKARAELAGWLDRQGRAAEAAPLRLHAVEVLQRVGAAGWLAELGLEVMPVVPG